MISLRVTDTYLLKYIDVCELSCKNVRWQTLKAGNVFLLMLVGPRALEIVTWGGR